MGGASGTESKQKIYIMSSSANRTQAFAGNFPRPRCLHAAADDCAGRGKDRAQANKKLVKKEQKGHRPLKKGPEAPKNLANMVGRRNSLVYTRAQASYINDF